MSVHVFIERSSDASREGKSRLATGLQAHYGVPASEVLKYLDAGRRFRIKSNVELDAAKRLVEELGRLGAVAVIADGRTGMTVPPAGAAPTATPPPIPKLPLPRRPPVSPPPSPSSSSSSSGGYESGLSAAKANVGEVNLGALDALGSVKLSSLDGEEEGTPAPPISVAAPAASAPSMRDDAFAAPSDHEEALELDMAPPPKGQLAEPPPEPLPIRTPDPDASRVPTRFAGHPGAGGTAAPAPSSAFLESLGRIAADPGRALFVGVFLALAIGYLPAMLYASSVTESRYALIRKDVEIAQSGMLTMTEWQKLPEVRREAVARLEKARTHIALTTFVLWSLSGAAVLYLWYRQVIPKLPAPPLRPSV